METQLSRHEISELAKDLVVDFFIALMFVLPGTLCFFGVMYVIENGVFLFAVATILKTSLFVAVAFKLAMELDKRGIL